MTSSSCPASALAAWDSLTATSECRMFFLVSEDVRKKAVEKYGFLNILLISFVLKKNWLLVELKLEESCRYVWLFFSNLLFILYI